jgi:hypothetical protein
VYTLFTSRKCPWHNDEEDYIKLVLNALEAYETVPDRRNMITDEMMYWLHAKASAAHPDSSIAAIVDWTILGRYAGFRKSEWCQSSKSDYARIEHWPTPQPPLAFIASDMVFLGHREERVRTTPRSTDMQSLLTLIGYVEICWRHQKNNQNGEKISFARDDDKPDFCPVRAALRIILRAQRLGVPPDMPIAVCASNKREYNFITDTAVASLYRDAASAVLKIPRGSNDIKLWSTHSLRVTAANLLHREKYSDSFIQTRLRWRSNTFLMYLRNTLYSATQHTRALTLSSGNLPPPHARTYREPEVLEGFLA